MRSNPELPKVIFIDDEESILKSIQRVMRKEPYQIVTTTDPNTVLMELERGGVAVVVSDQRMPVQDGVSVLENVKKVAPDAQRIMLTGYADLHAVVQAINRGQVSRFLAKPWEDSEIKEVIAEAVNLYRLKEENQRLWRLSESRKKKLEDLNLKLEEKVEERTQEIRDLGKKIEKSFITSIQLVDRLTQLHHPSIGNHSKRVAKLGLSIAKALGVTGKELLEFQVAAFLHDIGKIGVPHSVLETSRDKLGQEQLAQLKKHVSIGEALVNEISGMENVGVIVRHHHEQFNGKGYPDRLSGDQIPLGSRIISVVDAFDRAVYFENNYHQDSVDNALEFLTENSGVLFDPDVVTALYEYLEKMPQDEVEVTLGELKEGMTLSRNLYNPEGVILLQKGTVLKRSYLEKLENWLKGGALVQTIYVLRGAGKREAKKSLDTFKWGA